MRRLVTENREADGDRRASVPFGRVLVRNGLTVGLVRHLGSLHRWAAPIRPDWTTKRGEPPTIRPRSTLGLTGIERKMRRILEWRGPRRHGGTPRAENTSARNDPSYRMGLPGWTSRQLTIRCLTGSCLLLAAGGCGASNGSEVQRNIPDQLWTDQQIISAMNLKTNDSGLSYTTPGGCNVAVLLHETREVELYAGAGDTVVTDPSGTAGVKIEESAACRAEAEESLAALKP